MTDHSDSTHGVGGSNLREALFAERMAVMEQLDADPHNDLLRRKIAYLRYVRDGADFARNPDELAQKADTPRSQR